MTAETVQPTAPAAPAPFSATAARRLAAVECTAYTAAGITAAIGPQTDALWLHAGAVALGAGTLWRLWSRTRDADGARLLTTAYRSLPALGISGAYTAALITPGAAWWEYTAPLLAAGAAALAAPWTRSRSIRHRAEELPAVIEEQGAAVAQELPAPAAVDPYADGLTRLWAASPATGGTTLTQVRQYSPERPDFEAVILAPAGQAVPESVNERAVAAVFDVPVTAVDVAEIPGAGPGRLAVRVAPSLAEQRARQALTPDEVIEQVWAERVAARNGIAPGMHRVAHRIEDDRLVIRVEAEDSQMIRLPRVQLARALDVADPDLVMVETDGMARGVVTVYREHPLINIREATPEDLTMDATGRIVLGLQHDGRPARWPLYDPELGAITDLIVGAPGSGKSVTLNTVLAAERISGVVSIVADAQNGMSLPEARGRVYHFGAGIAAVGATLAAACAVGDYREQIAAANGWGACEIGRPWKLMNITIDEINKVLGAEAEVPREYRKWVTGLIGHFQLTGRKFLGGIRFAGQSIHLTDLGDSEKIRANAKNGSVWLGRVNSTMTASMAADMVTDGTEVTPIPKCFGSAAAEVEAAWSGEETPPGPITAGRAWHLQSGRAASMRTFKAVKENRAFPGLINLYESAPIPGLTPEEDGVFQEAYAIALEAAERLLAGEDPYAAEEDQEDGGKRTRKQETAAPRRSAVPTPPRTLPDLVLAALTDGPLRTREIRAAVGVGEPDGPASGSVDNALSKLAETGRVVKAGHGRWALPPTD
ncbi:hypothetical protein LIX60_25410 [Streptomyces sp. S07_1.15]|uniref:hypothetical protein n=1 Tax=Streptomyces sp. S07_1.15 TaxID=2873925 RepID=UPI001D147625|nr:hypothetical protein [Streptomyces sp. S07_1.15]MCC3654742.1 hypothetical protein [Streptomyces sp. S07_1.15]